MSEKPRLGIIIPYRDRGEHLSVLLPHLCAYFARDKTDKDIPVRIAIVEQAPGLPFNRGLLLNIGYKLVHAECDYVCFHDVDFLPIWADYSYPINPTMLVWYGIEGIPLDPANPDLGGTRYRNLHSMFSTVVLLQNEQFERANGFSNDYWGWGFEDGDLRNRLRANGFAIDHRMGTFTPLLHKHRGATGFDPNTRDLILTKEARQNQIFAQDRWAAPSQKFRDEGLNTAAFTLSARRRIQPPERNGDIVIEQYGVQLFCGVDYALPKVPNCWDVAPPIAMLPHPKPNSS